MKVKIGKYAFNLTATRAYLLVVFGLLLVPLVMGAYLSIPFYYQSTIKLEYMGQLYTFDSVVKCTPDPVSDIGGPTGAARFGEGHVYPRFLVQELPDGRQLIVNNNKCLAAYWTYIKNRTEDIDAALKSYPQVFVAKNLALEEPVEVYFGGASYNAPGSELKLMSQTMQRASYFDFIRYIKYIGDKKLALSSIEQALEPPINRLSCHQVFEFKDPALLARAEISPNAYPPNQLSLIDYQKSLGQIFLSRAVNSSYAKAEDIDKGEYYSEMYPLIISGNDLAVGVDMPRRGYCYKSDIPVFNYNFALRNSGGAFKFSYHGQSLEIPAGTQQLYIFDSRINALLVVMKYYGGPEN